MPRLESSYFRTEALGAAPSASICKQVNQSGDYKWTPEGKCLNISTGTIYGGKQSDSNCVCLGPPPKSSSGGAGAVLDFFKKTLLPGDPGPGRSIAPDSSFTASGLLVPAVLVVGGIGLLLILKKKK